MRPVLAFAAFVIFVLFSPRVLSARPPISVCELLDNADKFRGIVITVRGEIHFQYEELALYPTGCQFRSVFSLPYAIRQGDFSTVVGRLLHSTAGWNSLWIEDTDSTGERPSAFYAALRVFQASHPDNVPIPATIIGKLEAAPHRGYGHLGAYVAQIVVQSVRLASDK